MASLSNASYPMTLQVYGRDLSGDPQCIVLIKNEHTESYQELFKTEVQNNTSDPDWISKVIIEYTFQKRQDLKFVVIDFASNTEIGFYEAPLADLVIKNTSTVSLSNAGQLIIKLKQRKEVTQILHLTLQGNDLAKKDFFSESDPFFTISKRSNDSWVKVYHSEVIMDCSNPKWNPIQIPVKKLGGFDSPLLFTVYDYDQGETNDFIGETDTCINFLLQKTPIKLKEKDKVSGTLEVNTVFISEEYSFLDYLRTGTELCFMVGIDFSSEDIHSSEGRDVYSGIMHDIGKVLECYDHDKLFPIFGFGGKFKDSEDKPSAFALNRDENNPGILGIDQILETYTESLPSIDFEGPLLLSGVLQQAKDVCQQGSMHKKYHVLLLIVQNEFEDIENAISVIESSLGLPLSIIIVKTIDLNTSCDMLSAQSFERDVLTVVTFSSYLNSPSEFRKQVLTNIPAQLNHFMKSNGIFPAF